MIERIVGVRRMRGVNVQGVVPRVWEGLEESIVDFVSDEWRGKLPKILFESGGNGVDIEVRVRDVEVVAAFKAFFDSLDLGVPTRFAVDAFNIHA